MKFKVKKGVKIDSREGDSTPNGTVLYIFAEKLLPQEIRDNRPEGIIDASKMYYAFFNHPGLEGLPIAIVDSKVQVLSDDTIDFEVDTNANQQYIVDALESIEELEFSFYE